MNLLGEYQNGNYDVAIYDDGTKIRKNGVDFFTPSFPESMDVKITNYCEMNCPYCHEDSSIDGKHAELSDKFWNTVAPHTEIAIGGGDPLSHPRIKQFLQRIKRKKIIANITVSQKSARKNMWLLCKLSRHKLIHGIGISLDTFETDISDIIEITRILPNCVIHIINGVTPLKTMEELYDNDLRVLILGYKNIRRGIDYYSAEVEKNMQDFSIHISQMMRKFKIISFDNLAIEQLELRKIMSDKQWSRFYMGDDGQFTMYVDMVNREFASSSVSSKRYALTDNIKDMFNTIREGSDKIGSNYNAV